MIISEGYWRQLVRDGRAEHEGWVRGARSMFAILTRYDVQRVDHYPVRENSREFKIMLGARYAR
jgi:hypothetical protein